MTVDIRAEAQKMYVRGWTPEGMRGFRSSLCAMHGWTDDDVEAIATELEGIRG